MNRSPLSDFNRRRSLFDSPNFVRFINKTLHSQTKPIPSNLDSTTTSSTTNSIEDDEHYEHPRLAVTRKLNNMNDHSPLQLNRGHIQLSLVTSDNHLTLKSEFSIISVSIVNHSFHL